MLATYLSIFFYKLIIITTCLFLYYIHEEKKSIDFDKRKINIIFQNKIEGLKINSVMTLLLVKIKPKTNIFLYKESKSFFN